MVALVVIVEGYISRRDVMFSIPTAMNWRVARQAAGKDAVSAEILCFGTSLTTHGVLPAVIGPRCGRKVHNLAVFGGPMAANYFLLRRALEAGAHPKLILIDCQEGPLRRDEQPAQAEVLRVNRRQWPELLTPRDLVDLSWTARDPDFLATMTLSRVFCSFKSRFEIRANILAALNGRSASAIYESALLQYHWRINRGSHVYPATSVGPPKEVAGNPDCVDPRLATFPRHLWKKNELGESYLHRFLELASAHEIQIAWLLPPTGRRFQAIRNRMGMNGFYTDLAHEVQARYPNVVVIDARFCGYPNEAFHDEIHLNRRGATTFSDDIASVLVTVLADQEKSPKWVALPPYQARDPGFPLEDVDQSRISMAKLSERWAR
jgi:hypothetical protein